MSDEQVVPETTGITVELLATIDLGPESRYAEFVKLRDYPAFRTEVSSHEIRAITARPVEARA